MVRRGSRVQSPVPARCGNILTYTRLKLSLVEYLLAKQEVAGSNPVSRSGTTLQMVPGEIPGLAP